METLSATRAYKWRRLAPPPVAAIFMLHCVNPLPRPAFAPNAGLTITPDCLDRLLVKVVAAGFQLATLDDLAARWDTGESGAPLAIFTLDDGYRDNRDHALPVFARHGCPFTIFVTPGFSEGRVALWWEVIARLLADAAEVSMLLGGTRRQWRTDTLAGKWSAWRDIADWGFRARPEDMAAALDDLARRTGFDMLALTRALILSKDEICTLACHPLVTIGAHTVTHPGLASLTEEEALAELRGGADVLEDWTGRRPRHLAYPYGHDFVAATREFRLAQTAGYALAVTTRPGMVFGEHAAHRHALPRVSVNGGFQADRFLDVLISGAPFSLANRGRRLNVA